MIGAANRSRLFELRRDRAAAHRSAELLERKREVLLRELSKKTAARDALRASIAPRYASAHELLRVARVENGTQALRRAMETQQLRCKIERRVTRVMGVPLVGLTVDCEPFRADYGTADTTESADLAGAAFAALLPDVILLAQEELAVKRLRLALRKATKLLNALQKVVIPRIEDEIHTIAVGLEEEERDERSRVTLTRDTAHARGARASRH